ncbi:hypothetical protein FRC07_005455 [Ceratobasidium sp. 392]|nr:hypothetical protein FRC07_005455 [Ceratobasidium sp. 392]
MTSVVILGAGVIGLSTACKLQEKGYTVTIIAEHLPGDKKTIEYTSPWAGAHHVSRAEGDKVQEGINAYDARTFEVMWKMSEPGHPASGCFLRLHQTENFIKQPDSAHSPYWFMPGYKLSRDESQDKVTVEFETVTIDTSVYLPYLLSVFLKNGGKIVRARVSHLSQVAQGSYASLKPSVEDRDVFPIRGQVVLIHAPWIKFGISEKTPDYISYIIPRRNGDVVLGGTYGINDWYPYPRAETVDNIIRRALALSPLIAPPESRAGDRTPTVEDVKSIIVESGCGLRPGRKGGIRLERGEIEYLEGEGSKSIPVVYNYGHGGQGYQSSWGTAERAVELVEETLKA